MTNNFEEYSPKASCGDEIVISHFPIRTQLVLFKNTKSCSNNNNKKMKPRVPP